MVTTSSQQQRGDIAKAQLETNGSASSPSSPLSTGASPSLLHRRRRSRGAERRARGSGITLLASTPDLNFTALEIQESFTSLSHQQQVRLYYIYRAICEAQKLAFLQSSPESPAILSLFQELFSSPEETASPGELILELQGACLAKGLADTISKFFKYVVLFYHNSGNHDLLTGTKIVPEIPRFEFQEIILSSRAFTQRRGRRLQRAMDACLDQIYLSSADKTVTAPATTTSCTSKTSPSKPRASNTQHPSATAEATVVVLNETLGHPFYGPSVSYMDAVRVNRALGSHGILKINTRILKTVDDAPHATFHVLQTSIPTDTETLHNNKQELPKTLTMANHDQIRLFEHDFEPIVAKMAAFLNLAVCGSSSSTTDPFTQQVEETIALFTTPSLTSWRAMQSTWLVNGSSIDGKDDSSVQFLLSYARLPAHRDPTGTRGTLEGFVTVRNRFYQQRIDRLLLDTIPFLNVLPFHQLMGDGLRSKLTKLSVSCVDLVAASRSASLLPLISRLQLEDVPPRDDHDKLLYVVNCAEHYRDGQLTSEKLYLLDGLFTTEDAHVVEDEWDRVTFLRFVVEEIIAPRTRIVLRSEMDDGADLQGIALLPVELFVDPSDDEGGREGEEEQLLLEVDSDVDDDEISPPHTIRPGELLDAVTREALYMESSFAQKPTEWYDSRDPNDTYVAKFQERLATILEECRVMLVGLLLALDRHVRLHVCGQWSSSHVAETGDIGDQPGKETNTKDNDDGDDDDDPILNNVALAYVLLVLRDGLLALPFFATQQFRWEDDKMLARHMVLQMILTTPTHDPSRAVVEVEATAENVHRDITQLAFGVDEIRVQSLRVAVHTAPDTNTVVDDPTQRTRSWRNRLKIHVREWLQRIQWIQMTGDVAAGQELYEQFSIVSDQSLRYRQFLLCKLGDPDAVRKATEAAATGTTKRASSKPLSAVRPINVGLASDLQPVVPAPSMDVRNKLLALRSPSHFSRETIWIPPFLQLTEGPTHADRNKKLQRSPSGSPGDDDEEETDLPLVAQHQDRSRHDQDPVKTVVWKGTNRVVMREFPADLSFAIEAFVLNIGAITDQDAVGSLAVRMARNNKGEVASYATPRALETSEVLSVVDDYRKCAKLAKQAGFDGVEVHSAGGYLLDSFLQSVTNTRTDKYGGSLENRARFLLEVVDAVKTEWETEGVAVRMSPNSGHAGMGSTDTYDEFMYVASELSKTRLGYLAVMDGMGFGYHDKGRLVTAFDAKSAFKGTVMANCSYDRDTGEGVLRSGAADLVSFGRPYISTPDLAERFQNDWPLNAPSQPQTWWDASLGAEGYIDYSAYTA